MKTIIDECLEDISACTSVIHSLQKLLEDSMLSKDSGTGGIVKIDNFIYGGILVAIKELSTSIEGHAHTLKSLKSQ